MMLSLSLRSRPQPSSFSAAPSGLDPGDGFDRAAALTEQAIAADSAPLEAQLTLADIFLNRAWWESKTGADPRPTVDRAVAAYEEVLRADRRNVAAADNIGQALLLRGRYENSQGLDATASLDRALTALQAAATIDPTMNVLFNTLARIADTRAEEQQRRGVDSRPGLLAVIQFITELPDNDAPASRRAALEKLQARLAGRP
jgi:hypothetical protein